MSGVLVPGANNRETFRTEQGPWVTLIRAGHILYGVAKDPIVEVEIMLAFERDDA